MRIWLGKPNNYRCTVDDIDRQDFFVAFTPGDQLAVFQNEIKSEADVLRRYRLAILPFQIPFQPVRPSQPVGADPSVGLRRHFLRQIGYPFAFFVLQQQSGKHQPPDILHRSQFTDQRIPCFRLDCAANADLAASSQRACSRFSFFGLFAAPGKSRQHQNTQGDQHQFCKQFPHCYSRPLSF